METNQAKRRPGRPKDSTSFIMVKVSELAEKLGPGANAKVSRVWLRELGLLDTAPAPPIEVLTRVPTPEPATEDKIQFTVHE